MKITFDTYPVGEAYTRKNTCNMTEKMNCQCAKNKHALASTCGNRASTSLLRPIHKALGMYVFHPDNFARYEESIQASLLKDSADIDKYIIITHLSLIEHPSKPRLLLIKASIDRDLEQINKHNRYDKIET